MIKLGKDLIREEIDLINLWRQKEFGSEDLIDPKPNNQDWTNIFIFVNDKKGKIRAFGKLNPLDLKFLDQTFSVLCFSTVISIEKRKGYGQKVMDEIKKYSGQIGITVIGFCETELLPFYRKCGYKILDPEDNRFVFIDTRGEIVPDIVPGEVIFNQGRDRVMEKILKSGKEPVKIQRQ